MSSAAKKNRKMGVHRTKISLFVLPEILYLLEQLAVSSGCVRTGDGRYRGRANVNQYLENWLNASLNVRQYNVDQINAMRNHMQQVLDQRKDG